MADGSKTRAGRAWFSDGDEKQKRTAKKYKNHAGLRGQTGVRVFYTAFCFFRVIFNEPAEDPPHVVRRGILLHHGPVASRLQRYDITHTRTCMPGSRIRLKRRSDSGAAVAVTLLHVHYIDM